MNVSASEKKTCFVAGRAEQAGERTIRGTEYGDEFVFHDVLHAYRKELIGERRAVDFPRYDLGRQLPSHHIQFRRLEHLTSAISCQ